MSKKVTHKYFSTLGALLLCMQIALVSFHQIEHQHDDSTTQECHLCLFLSQNQFIGYDSTLRLETNQTTFFSEKEIFVQKFFNTSKQKEGYFLRGPPLFHIS